MTYWVLYDSDGTIRQNCSGPASSGPPTVAGLTALEVDTPVDPFSHAVVDGAVVAYSTEQAAARRARPGKGFVWDPNVREWIDNRALAVAKSERVAALRDDRDDSLYAGFTWDGSTFDSDERSQTVLLGMYVSSQQPEFTPKQFRLADNSWRELDAEDMAGVWAALSAHVESHFEQFALREAAVNACSTLAEVEAVTWAG